MSIDFAQGRSTQIRVLAAGVPDRRYSNQLRTMAAEGFESELRVELTHSDRTWGALALLRERGREALRGFAERSRPEVELISNVWELTHRVRRTGAPVVCRVLTSRGWVVLDAQLLDGVAVGDVAVTIQPASAYALLPALAAWHDVTPRERLVLERLLEGLSGKEIARALGVSQHTVNDHLKAVHRKFGVRSRGELIARLSG